MTQSLVVNSQTYLASAEIARSFGYTPDYVSRLAREGKVAATNINRKWFVSQESMEEFARSTDVEKETRSSDLKKQRKVERLIHAQEEKEVAVKHEKHSHIALAQSCAVLMCGAFVGLLGWSVSGADMTLAELSVGFEKTYTQIGEAVTPNENPFTLFSKWSAVASVQESVIHEEVVREIVPTPVVKEDPAVIIENQDGTRHQYDGMNFSDEVDVRFVDDGTGVVRPVFRNEKDGQEYQMLLAPVTPGG